MRRTGPSDSQRATLRKRAGGRCERCGRHQSTAEVHHRQPRQIGGSTMPEVNLVSNLLWLCRACHRQIEANREVSYRNGWLVRRPLDPPAVPVRLWDGWYMIFGSGVKVSVSGPAAGQDRSDPAGDG